mgnify:CR=1 FL=1
MDEQFRHRVLADQIMEPLYESKPEGYIAEELAKRLDVDPKTVNTMTDAERTYSSLAGAMYMTDADTMAYAPCSPSRRTISTSLALRVHRKRAS